MKIPATEFKAHCLKLMDQVAETHESIVITKRGKPVAKLVSVEEKDKPELFGCMAGSITITGDILKPIEQEWSAITGDEDELYGDLIAPPSKRRGRKGMNGLLLDTHTWVWFAEGNRELLSDDVAQRITESMQDGSAYLSVISVWELGVLEAKGRIGLSTPVTAWVTRFFDITKARQAELTNAIALDSCFLPNLHHKDPADRFLIATARHYDLTLLTRDEKILAYGQTGHVRTEKI